MTSLWARPEQVTERYRQGRLLGRGGAADVFEAHDATLDRRVALKVLRDVDSTDRFRVEAQTLARLRHPGLVTVLDAGELDGRPFLVMELIDGVTLADCCRGTALEHRRVAAIGAQLAETLEHVHVSGVIHRDVKPANIMLGDDGRVLLTDFGIARLLEGAAPTETGLTLGTAAYLSPEQARCEPLTPAVDIYSLGLVLLEALTGTRAFPGPAVEAALARLQRGPDVPASLSPEWRRLLTAMTALTPEHRPTLSAAATSLRTLADGIGANDAARALLVEVEPEVPTLVPEDATRVQTSRRTSRRPSLNLRTGPQPVRRTRRSLRRPPVLLAVLGALLLGLLLVVPALTGDPEPAGSRVRVPAGVPADLAPDLQRLHDAVEGR